MFIFFENLFNQFYTNIYYNYSFFKLCCDINSFNLIFIYFIYIVQKVLYTIFGLIELLLLLYKLYFKYQVEILFSAPFISFIIIQLFCKKNEIKKIKKISLVFSWFILIHSINVTFNLFIKNKPLLNEDTINFSFKYLNYYYNLFDGIDYIVLLFDTNLIFIILVSLITFSCILISWSREVYHYKLLVSIFFLLEFFAIQFFSVYNLFFVYVYFEATIIPTLILIGVWGSRLRKNIAFYYIYFITGFGSILMLLGILILYNKLGTLNTLELANLILNEKLEAVYKHLVWILLTLCFIIKLPGFLFYNWLLEAHVEAPIEGSVILSGYILKYAIWGLVGHVFLIFPFISNFYSPYLIIIAMCSIIYSTLSAIRTHDFKKCVAYTSIAHMSLALFGLVVHSSLGVKGCLILSFSHSITSPGLFILAGILYEKYGLRDIRYLGNIVLFPFSLYFFLLSLSNIGFPGTINFLGEVLIFCSLGELQSVSSYIAILISIFFGAVFGIWILTRINFTFSNNKQFSDISFKEHSVLFLYCIIVIWFGIHFLPLSSFINDISSFYSVIRNNFLF